MTSNQVKKLKTGDRVKWLRGDSDADRGTVTSRVEFCLSVSWDNGSTSDIHPRDCVHIERL